MKTWIVKAFAPIALKKAIGYAYKLTLLIHAALQGILDDGNITDAHRANLNMVISAIAAIRDFTGKLITVFGVSSGTMAALPAFPLNTALSDSINRLNEAAEAL